MKLNECLVVIAHPDELNDALKKMDNLLTTGVGKVNAAYHLCKKLSELKSQGKSPKYVINFGSAGSKKYPRGTLVYCHKFIQWDMDCSIFGYEKGKTPSEDTPVVLEHKCLINDLPIGISGSGDSFVTTQEINPTIDVVDMEAYALAKVCHLEGIDFIAIKYITDGLDETGHDDWKDEVKSSADTMYEYLIHITSGDSDE